MKIFTTQDDIPTVDQQHTTHFFRILKAMKKWNKGTKTKEKIKYNPEKPPRLRSIDQVVIPLK